MTVRDFLRKLLLYHAQVIYKSMNGGLSGEDDKKNT